MANFRLLLALCLFLCGIGISLFGIEKFDYKRGFLRTALICGGYAISSTGLFLIFFPSAAV